MKAYLQHGAGTAGPFLTECLEAKRESRILANSSRTGYGSRLPTCFMVKYANKWRRVYAICYSNASTCYIGKRSDNLIISHIEEV